MFKTVLLIFLVVLLGWVLGSVFPLELWNHSDCHRLGGSFGLLLNLQPLSTGLENSRRIGKESGVNERRGATKAGQLQNLTFKVMAGKVDIKGVF